MYCAGITKQQENWKLGDLKVHRLFSLSNYSDWMLGYFCGMVKKSQQFSLLRTPFIAHTPHRQQPLRFTRILFQFLTEMSNVDIN